MMDSPEIDLVTVAVRISRHHPIVLAAVEAGKHVFCEWPLAVGVAQASELRDHVLMKGLRHAVGTRARFSPGLRYANQLLDQGWVGRPLLFHATHYLSTGAGPVPSHRWWLTQIDEGGGALLIASGHALDVVRWLLGDVVAVSSRVETLVPELRFSDTGEHVRVTAIDTVACLVRLASGVTGTVHVSIACRHGSGFRLEIHGTDRRLIVESPQMVQYSPTRISGLRGSESLRDLAVPAHYFEVPELPADSPASHVAQLLRRFIAAIHESSPFHPDFGDAVTLHRILDALRASSETGRWIAVDSEPPE